VCDFDEEGVAFAGLFVGAAAGVEPIRPRAASADRNQGIMVDLLNATYPKWARCERQGKLVSQEIIEGYGRIQS
jgi:hypothetical protein